MIASGRFDDGTLRNLLGALPVAVIALDSEGRVQTWDPIAEELLGWTSQEVLGTPIPLALPQEERAELRYLRRDGEWIDLEVRMVAWTDSTGASHGTIAVVRDLTRRRVTERTVNELRAQGEEARNAARESLRFQELLEAAPDAIIEVDREGRIVLLNRVTEQLFGYTRAELLNQPVDILIPRNVREGHHAHRQRYWSHPTTRPMGSGLTLEGERKDGSRFPVEISLSPVKSEDDFRVSAIIRDVSERKHAEGQLRAVEAAYAAELTAKNHELAARNDQVERADRLKSEFLSGMSHELRTPLHTIIGFTELLREELEGPLNVKQQRFMEHIHRDAHHLLALINDVLDLSKIEAGRLELKHEQFALLGALEDTISSLRPRADSKAIRLEITATPETIEVYADRLRIKQVLYNLLSNAIKFTPNEGRVSVDVLRQGNFVEISITDTGVGIAPAEHDSVFDKFYQVGQRQAGGHEGTGLGLAITRHLVEEHGGSIQLQSEVGRGAKFTFTIPLEQESGAATSNSL